MYLRTHKEILLLTSSSACYLSEMQLALNFWPGNIYLMEKCVKLSRKNEPPACMVCVCEGTGQNSRPQLKNVVCFHAVYLPNLRRFKLCGCASNCVFVSTAIIGPTCVFTTLWLRIFISCIIMCQTRGKINYRWLYTWITA